MVTPPPNNINSSDPIIPSNPPEVTLTFTIGLRRLVGSVLSNLGLLLEKNITPAQFLSTIRNTIAETAYDSSAPPDLSEAFTWENPQYSAIVANMSGTPMQQINGAAELLATISGSFNEVGYDPEVFSSVNYNFALLSQIPQDATHENQALSILANMAQSLQHIVAWSVPKGKEIFEQGDQDVANIATQGMAGFEKYLEDTKNVWNP